MTYTFTHEEVKNLIKNHCKYVVAREEFIFNVVGKRPATDITNTDITPEEREYSRHVLAAQQSFMLRHPEPSLYQLTQPPR